MQNSETMIGRLFDIGMYVDILHLSDAKLRTDDGCTFDVHRSILAMNNDYFRAMFCDIGKRDFTIPGITGECLSEILCYVYTGDIEVTEKNVTDLMIAANFLLLNDFHAEIKQSIIANMTEHNCLNILLTAHHISEEDIFKESFRFIQTRFEAVVRCQKGELADLPLDIFRSVLSNRSLFVYNETTVWQAIIEWTRKDIPSRMCYVSQLLLTLAMEEVGEELATDILQHEIIYNNSLMSDLKFSEEFTCNVDVLLGLMNSSSNHFTQPYSHRIPLNLHFILCLARGTDGAVNSNNLYVTYDENLDLWRQITEVEFRPHSLVAIGRNIFILGMEELHGVCRKFDLSVMDWVTMQNVAIENFSSTICVLAIDGYIYVIVGVVSRTPVIEVYDTANDRWFRLGPNILISESRFNAAVAIEKKIYLVSNVLIASGMMVHMFDVVTQQWTLLPSPAVSRWGFALVAYHGKIYLMAGRAPNLVSDILSVEVFDPANNIWKELPNLPYTYRIAKAVVFNDQIIVYESFGEVELNTKTVRWNEAIECWEKLDKTYAHINFCNHRFCSIDDVDTIKMITKQNRDPKSKIEKSIFI